MFTLLRRKNDDTVVKNAVVGKPPLLPIDQMTSAALQQVIDDTEGLKDHIHAGRAVVYHNGVYPEQNKGDALSQGYFFYNPDDSSSKLIWDKQNADAFKASHPSLHPYAIFLTPALMRAQEERQLVFSVDADSEDSIETQIADYLLAKGASYRGEAEVKVFDIFEDGTTLLLADDIDVIEKERINYAFAENQKKAAQVPLETTPPVTSASAPSRFNPIFWLKCMVPQNDKQKLDLALMIGGLMVMAVGLGLTFVPPLTVIGVAVASVGATAAIAGYGLFKVHAPRPGGNGLSVNAEPDPSEIKPV